MFLNSIGGILELSNSILQMSKEMIIIFAMEVVETHKSFLPYKVVQQVFNEEGDYAVAMYEKTCFEAGAFIQPILAMGKCVFDDTDPRTQRFYFIDHMRFRYGFYRELDDTGRIEYAKKTLEYFWELPEDNPILDTRRVFKIPEELRIFQDIMECNQVPVGARERLNLKASFRATFRP